jgi:hypothetical protein
MPSTPLAWAVSQLGVKELTGRNDGPQIKEYLLGEEGLPWCAAFVQWCYAQCRISLPVKNKWLGRSVRNLYLAFRDAHALRPDAQPNRIVFFGTRGASDAGSGWHIGLIESVTDENLTTIEGNYQNRVARVHHSRIDPRIVGYAEWPISSKSFPPNCFSGG